VADDVGDCLTYYILTDDKYQVLARSFVRSATRSETNYRLQFDPVIESLVDKEYIERRTEQMERGKRGKAATTANDADMVARDTNIEVDVIVRDENAEIMVNDKAQSAMSEDETGTDVGYEDDETNEGPDRVSDDSNNTASYTKGSSKRRTSLRKQQENYLHNRKATTRKVTHTSPSWKPKKDHDKIKKRQLKTPNTVATQMTPIIPDEEEEKSGIQPKPQRQNPLLGGMPTAIYSKERSI
jgi:intein/homing endonuclease